MSTDLSKSVQHRFLKLRKKSLIIIQGVVKDTLFDELRRKKVRDVVVMEGRPRLEAARMNCRALIKRGITPTLIADNMAGFLFYKDLVKEVWVSYQLADRKGALCDIGSLVVGVLGKRHKIPVRLYPAGRKSEYVGKAKDLVYFNADRVAPAGVVAFVPLMEWLPGKYITKVYDGRKNS